VDKRQVRAFERFAAESGAAATRNGVAHVGLAGVIDEEHDRLVLGLLQGEQVKAVGDLDLGVLQAFRGTAVQRG
jgi:hypothetical protein